VPRCAVAEWFLTAAQARVLTALVGSGSLKGAALKAHRSLRTVEAQLAGARETMRAKTTLIAALEWDRVLRSGRPLPIKVADGASSRTGRTILRLSKRPRGVTISEAATNLGLPDNDVSSRIAQFISTGRLRKEAGTPNRYFYVDREED
jgi:hypothetical protein